MSPQSRKTSPNRSVLPFGSAKFLSCYKHGIKAQRPRDTTIIALMTEIKSMQRQFNYQSHKPDIVRWEEVLPFGANVLRGDRSHQDYKESWTCICGGENEPSRRRLFDIPALQCRSCGREVIVCTPNLTIQHVLFLHIHVAILLMYVVCFFLNRLTMMSILTLYMIINYLMAYH